MEPADSEDHRMTSKSRERSPYSYYSDSSTDSRTTIKRRRPAPEKARSEFSDVWLVAGDLDDEFVRGLQQAAKDNNWVCELTKLPADVVMHTGRERERDRETTIILLTLKSVSPRFDLSKPEF
eukprot:12232994-Karenia_brevis.AAC.1